MEHQENLVAQRMTQRMIQRKKTAILGLAVGFTMLGSSLAVAKVPEPVKSFTDRVVRISSQDAGFGFVVGRQGHRIYIVTANHVVRSPDTDEPYGHVSVTFSVERGKSFPATILATRLIEPHDLAILEVTADNLAIPPGCLAKERTDFSGTDVWFIGRKGKFSVPAMGGRINDTRPDENGMASFDSTGLAAGTSGAPLLDSNGLVGLVLEYDGKSTGRYLSAHLIQRVVESWGYPWDLETCQLTNDPCPSNSLGMQFAEIPAGELVMGSGEGEADEQPVHRVTLSQPFCLGRYEVTQHQWRAVMGSNPSHFRGSDRPVESVSWFDVQDFLKRLNEGEGTKAYRLPTEAEWEYVARAGRTEGSSNAERVAWHNHNAGGMTQPVGRLDGNPWGVYDLFGNVWEWLADYYGPYALGPKVDPSGPQSGQYRVVRGGSWRFGEQYMTFSFRNNASPGSSEPDLGFRVVRNID